MRILFAGGGTAGHINPALAIAGTVREREPDAAILYVGAKGGMEEKLVPKALILRVLPYPAFSESRAGPI